MIKIKISYNTDEELAGVIRLLSPVMKSWRVSRNKEGRYKKLMPNSGGTPRKQNND